MIQTKYQCKICGKEYGKITAGHLKLHGYTREMYMKEFGSEGIQGVNMACLYSSNYNDADSYAIDRHLRIQRKMGAFKRRQP